MRRPTIIANWKANPATPRKAIELARKVERRIGRIKNVEVVIAPPFPFLAGVGRILRRAKLGAQDAFWTGGPYTGEVSPVQLAAVGVSHVIIGHSERRIHLGESDETIQKKLPAVLGRGLAAILCVGERERAGSEIPAIVGTQLEQALAGVKKSHTRNLLVAYEPIWAISTTPGAAADTPEGAFRAMLYIRRILSRLYGRPAAESVRVLYGGSVTPENAQAFLREGKMDGALVGGASLDPDEFAEIVRRAAGR